MNDPLRIVAEWAEVAGTTLAGLVGTRVYKGSFRGDSFTNSAAAIVIVQTSVTSEIEANVHYGTYAIRCYGGTSDPDDAAKVFRAVHDRYHNAKGSVTTGGFLFSFFETGTPTVDPDMGYPVYVAMFRIATV